MRILPITSENLTVAVRTIRAGGIVAHATETCYGFACDLTNADAVQKLFALKKRPGDMPVSALFASVEHAKKFVEWSDAADELARKYLPGPLTIVLPLRAGASAKFHLSINGTHGVATVGVRVSSNPVAQQLVELAGVPLSTTSANIHEKPEPYSVQEIQVQFEGQKLQPDLILDSGRLPLTKPSTVVVVRDDTIEVVRIGEMMVPSRYGGKGNHLG